MRLIEHGEVKKIGQQSYNGQSGQLNKILFLRGYYIVKWEACDGFTSECFTIYETNQEVKTRKWQAGNVIGKVQKTHTTLNQLP